MNQQTGLCGVVALVLGGVLAVGPGCVSGGSGGDAAWSNTYTEFAVAADHRVASEAGAEILAMGGNAVDAAVATSFTLSVVRPFSCGIGGGGFMVINLPATGDRAAVEAAFNYRETAPGAVGPMFYVETGASSLRGATAAGVPGTVAGLLEVHGRYGSLSLAQVMEPAIRAARDGFVADKSFVNAAQGRIAHFEKHPEHKERFAFVWERYCREGRIRVGDRIKNPEHARALEKIASEGASAFYEGEIAEAIVRAVENDGGVMTLEDLTSYEVVQSRPMVFQYRGMNVMTMPPPSSGGVALGQICGIYDRLVEANLKKASETGQLAHYYAEASAHAFADRAEYLADPAFVDVPEEWLLSDERLDELAGSVDVNQTGSADEYGSHEPMADDHGTSHFSIIDADGGAVACTETINTSFGSMLAVPEFGFVLNNEMDDFTTIPGEANTYGLIQSDKNLPAPGKRPLSSMTPTIVSYGPETVLVTGASGGPRIISAVAQTILEPSPLGGEGDLSAPRIHHQWLPFGVQHEEKVSSAVITGLRERGHVVRPRVGVGVAQTVRLIGSGRRMLEAQSDPRKGGAPSGR